MTDALGSDLAYHCAAYLTNLLEKEKDEGSFYEKIPFHYMEIAMLLLDR